MAVIKSGATSDQLTVDPTSKAARVTLYGSEGSELGSAAYGDLTPATAENFGKQYLGVVPVSSWNITSFPGTATQATVSKALNATGRHVCTAFCVSIAIGGTTSTALVRWVIRDGATGAGTILWQGAMGQNPIGLTNTVAQSDLCLIGSTNTAMTIEFAAGGTTASQQAVNLQGFDCA